MCPSPPPLQENRCPNWRRGREGPAQGAAPAGGGRQGPGFRTVSVTSTRTSWPRSEPSSYRSDLGSGLWNQVSALCSLLSALCSLLSVLPQCNISPAGHIHAGGRNVTNTFPHGTYEENSCTQSRVAVATSSFFTRNKFVISPGLCFILSITNISL